MESLDHFILEVGLVALALALGFLSLRLRNKFSKGSLFASPLSIFALAGFLLGITYSVDMALDYAEVDVYSLPFFLNFLFILTLTYGVYRLYSRARKGNIELNKTKEELADAQAKLVKSERLAAIGELAGMVGHDLRNPLMGIKGATYYLRIKQGTMTYDCQKMLNTIDKCIDYSDKIVNDLVEYSRELKFELTPTTPSALLKDTLIMAQVPEKIEVLDATEEQPKIMIDVQKMNRCFINIIKNAFDSMPNGGKLTIKSQKVKDNITFSFEDTGVGMSQETLNKLWTPLFTTKAKGMGLGLAISKRIVEALGGKISVKSAVGKGTTFTVTVPIEPKVITEAGPQLIVADDFSHPSNKACKVN